MSHPREAPVRRLQSNSSSSLVNLVKVQVEPAPEARHAEQGLAPPSVGDSSRTGSKKSTPEKGRFAPLEDSLPSRRSNETKNATTAADLKRYAIRLQYQERKPLSTRDKVWKFMDDPQSSRLANYFAVCIMCLIFVSCVAVVVETLPSLHRRNQTFWLSLEAVCIGMFTIEFLLRVVSAPSFRQYVNDPLNWVDLLAILPFFIEVAVAEGDPEDTGSGIFRIVRLVRVFRVLKISRYVSWIRLFTHVMTQSAGPLAMLLFMMTIAVVLFSSLMFYAEGNSTLTPDGQIAFSSISDTFWWSIVTMTTVGYGDVFPVTAYGKFIACVTSLSGILVLAIPITVISTNFKVEFDKMVQVGKLDFQDIRRIRNELVSAYQEAYPTVVEQDSNTHSDEPDPDSLGAAPPEDGVELANIPRSSSVFESNHSHLPPPLLVGRHVHEEVKQESGRSPSVGAMGDPEVDSKTQRAPFLDLRSSVSTESLHQEPGKLLHLNGQDVYMAGGKPVILPPAPRSDPLKQAVDDLRFELAAAFEAQIDEIVARSEEQLLEKIGDLVQGHRRLVQSQIEKVIQRVPIFVREEVQSRWLDASECTVMPVILQSRRRTSHGADGAR